MLLLVNQALLHWSLVLVLIMLVLGAAMELLVAAELVVAELPQ
jgi:hypothetical protein